jgi:hypothetical protein
MTDDDLLRPPFPERESADLRRRVEERTLPVVRARGRWRQVRRVAAGLALFVAGVGAHAGYLRLSLPADIDVPAPAIANPVEPLPTPALPGSPEKNLRSAPKSAGELELLAEQLTDPAAMARAFRQAGDRYYETERNYAAALRCYRSFLQAARIADLQESPDDNVLLTTLKNARKLELQS